jgi:hypothetical protein
LTEHRDEEPLHEVDGIAVDEYEGKFRFVQAEYRFAFALDNIVDCCVT